MSLAAKPGLLALRQHTPLGHSSKVVALPLQALRLCHAILASLPHGIVQARHRLGLAQLFESIRHSPVGQVGW